MLSLENNWIHVFPKHIVLCENANSLVQDLNPKVTMSIFYDDNYYTTSTSSIYNISLLKAILKVLNLQKDWCRENFENTAFKNVLTGKLRS